MVNCVCGRPIEKLPNWLQSVKVDFVCNNCPQRTVATARVEVTPRVNANEVNEMPEIDKSDEDEDLD